MKQAEEKYKIREISYLFQTLEKEWERSGRTVTKRKLDQDALDIFSEYYVRRVKEYEKEQDNIKTKTIQKMVKEIKETLIYFIRSSNSASLGFWRIMITAVLSLV